MLNTPSGMPGVGASTFASPRNIFFGDATAPGALLPFPIVFDGNLAYNAANAPYTWLAFAGTLIGRVTATGKYASSVLGLTSAALTTSGTTLTTDTGTAAGIVSRIGTSGTFNLAGPPTSGGTVAVDTVTFSAINTSTGAITITATSTAFVSGSMIMPTDGSQSIVTVLADYYGIKTTDWTNVNKVDALVAKAYGGGIINCNMLVNYPSDTSLKAYVKSQIRGNGVPAAMFSDDFGF